MTLKCYKVGFLFLLILKKNAGRKLNIVAAKPGFQGIIKLSLTDPK